MVGVELLVLGFVIVCIAVLTDSFSAVRKHRRSNTSPGSRTSPPPGGVEELPLPIAGTDGQTDDTGFFEDTGYVEDRGGVAVKGLKALRQLGGVACGLVSIVGPAREGKSFLLNRLWRSSIFPVQNDILGVGTQGISIGHPLTLQELCLSTGGKATGGTLRGSGRNSSSTLAFADTEGLGGYGGLERDVRLVASLLPFSRAVIFNWMGGFQVDTILHQLGLFTTRVLPMLSAGSRRRSCLGFLHIVLRDIDMKSLDYEVRLSELLLLPETLPRSDNPNNAAGERNQIRATLRHAFRGISVWTLPHPFTRHGSLLISDDFAKQVDRLRTMIAGQVTRLLPTSGLGLEAVTGTVIANQLPSLLDSTLPSADLPTLPSSPCSSFQRATVKEAIVLYQEHLRTFASELKQGYPMTEGDLNQSFTSKGTQIREDLNKSMVCVTDRALRQSTATEADDLWFFYLHQAVNDNRLAKKEALQRELLSVKDQVVRSLSTELRADSRRGDINAGMMEWPWLDVQETDEANEEVTAFTRIYRAEFESAVEHKAEEMRRQYERETVTDNRLAERRRDLDRERERKNQSKRCQKQQTLREEKYELGRQRQDLVMTNMTLIRETVTLKEETEDLKLVNSRLENHSEDLQTLAEDLASTVRVTDEQRRQIAADKVHLEEKLQMEVAERACAENVVYSLGVQLLQTEQGRIEEREIHGRSQEQMQKEKRAVEERLNESLEALEVTTATAIRQEQEAAQVQQQLAARVDQESERRRSERLAYQTKVEDMTNEREAMERDHEEERRRTAVKKMQLTQKKDDLVSEVVIQRAANCELVRVTDELKKQNLDLEERIGGHMADWLWQDDSGKWQSYDDSTVEDLEKAYKQQQGKVSANIGRWLYEVDLRRVENMTQKNQDTGKVRKVKREKMTFAGYPDSWEKQTQDIHKVTLTEDEDEFKEVEKLFHDSMSRATFRIKHVQRIQHRFLWHEYQLAKQRMHRKNKRSATELKLFHGTGLKKPDAIYRSEKGFDTRFSKKGLWGFGTYFAEKASYSDVYAHPTRARGSMIHEKQMFLAKVLTGISHDDAPLDRERKIPDFRPSTGMEGNPGEDIQYRYDSLNGVTGGSRVHIIFDNGHAYPHYLITYS